jgi:hypothetical protein
LVAKCCLGLFKDNVQVEILCSKFTSGLPSLTSYKNAARRSALEKYNRS